MNLELQLDRDAAEQFPCPEPPRGCGRPAGVSCRNLRTGDLLDHQPAHAARIKAAGIRHEPIDPEQLAARHERTPRR